MKTPRRTIPVRSVVAIGFTVIVVAAAIGGVFLMESPAQERQYRFDERRVADLREVAYALDRYWTREGTLPATLEDLVTDRAAYDAMFDPETGDPYEYRLVGEEAFELCAIFTSESADEYSAPYNDFWYHGAGRQCFRITAQDAEKALWR